MSGTRSANEWTVGANRSVSSPVGAGGLIFAFRAAEGTGSDAADVVRAHAVATRVFGLGDTATVEALDGRVPAHAQALMLQQHQRLLDRAVRWFLHARPEGIDVGQRRWQRASGGAGSSPAEAIRPRGGPGSLPGLATRSPR